MDRFEKESSNLPPPEIMSPGEDPLFLFSANDLASWHKLPNPLVDLLVGDPENFPKTCRPPSIEFVQYNLHTEAYDN